MSCRDTCQHLVSADHPVHIDVVSDTFSVCEINQFAVE